MTKQYIRILTESLCRKKELLEQLTRLSEKQSDLVKKEITDWGTFDECTDQKAGLIEELNKLDEGFDLVFGRVKDDLTEQKEEYREEIAFLQKCIRMVTDLSVSLEALEHRNKQTIEGKFQLEKKNVGKRRVTAKAATTYYQNTRQINTVDPQLLDRKK